MIPQYSIQEWHEQVPWNTDAMVEQDLIICRALISIFSDEFLASQLAFRGGTALHKRKDTGRRVLDGRGTTLEA